MDEKLLISVIVPVYNVEQYLAKCVDSILEQTYMNIELLLINDGSTDGSPAICDEYARLDKRIKVFHKKNEGVSSARNTGLDLAKGDFISFVDSDDWIEKQSYEELMKCTIKNNADAVLFEYFIDYENGVTKQPSHKSCEGVFDAARAVELSISPVNRFAVTKFYSKNIIGNTRFDSTIHFGEDTLFACNVLSNASRVYYLAKPFYHYYQSAISATRSDFNSKVFSGVTAYKQVYDLCVRKFPEIRDVALSAYLNITVNVLVELEKHPQFENSGVIKRDYLSIVRIELKNILMASKIRNRMKLKFIIAAINPVILKNSRNYH